MKVSYETGEIKEFDISNIESKISSLNFHRAIFEEIKFLDVIFENCDLRSANFYKTKFKNVIFLNCKMMNIVFHDCSFEKATISESSLVGGQITNTNTFQNIIVEDSDLAFLKLDMKIKDNIILKNCTRLNEIEWIPRSR